MDRAVWLWTSSMAFRAFRIKKKTDCCASKNAFVFDETHFKVDLFAIFPSQWMDFDDAHNTYAEMGFHQDILCLFFYGAYGNASFGELFPSLRSLSSQFRWTKTEKVSKVLNPIKAIVAMEIKNFSDLIDWNFLISCTMGMSSMEIYASLHYWFESIPFVIFDLEL